MEMNRDYAELRGCRRECVLAASAESWARSAEPATIASPGPSEDEGAREPLPQGSCADHEGLIGLARRYEDDEIVFLFDGVGYKNLDAGRVPESGLPCVATWGASSGWGRNSGG